MKVHVFSDFTLCVGGSNPDPSNNWATQLEDVWNEHGHVEKLNLVVPEVQIVLHVLPVASTLDLKKHIQTYLNCQNVVFFCLFDERTIFMLMFNVVQRICSRKATEVRC